MVNPFVAQCCGYFKPGAGRLTGDRTGDKRSHQSAGPNPFALLSAEGGRDVAYNQNLDEDTNTANTKQGTFKLRWQNRFLTADYRFAHLNLARFGPSLLNLSPQSDLLCNRLGRCS